MPPRAQHQRPRDRISAKIDLTLVDLSTGTALGAIGAATRLTTARSDEYRVTQQIFADYTNWPKD